MDHHINRGFNPHACHWRHGDECPGDFGPRPERDQAPDCRARRCFCKKPSTNLYDRNSVVFHSDYLVKLIILLILVIPTILFLILMFKAFGWIAGLSFLALVKPNKESAYEVTFEDHEARMESSLNIGRILSIIFCLLVIVLIVKNT